MSKSSPLMHSRRARTMRAVLELQSFASLPWYDLPETRTATDALWEALAGLLASRGLSDLPLSLDRSRPYGTDADGACLFSQTCGYLLFAAARDQFTVLGAPLYAVAGCAGPLHRSFVVVRDEAAVRKLEDLRGARFALNELDSNTGMNLPRRLFAPLARNGRFFGGTVVSGSHAASAALVAAGDADAAAIDCVTFALLERYRPAATRPLRIVAETVATPAPPFVTSRTTNARLVAALRDALAELMSAQTYAPLREALYLAGVDECDERAYDVLLGYERDAERLGYPILR